MKTVPLGSTDTRVPNVVAGMMCIAGSTDDQIRALYTAARESGINFFDHADLYGFNHPAVARICVNSGSARRCDSAAPSASRSSSSPRPVLCPTRGTTISPTSTSWNRPRGR